MHSLIGGAFHKSQKGKLLDMSQLLVVREWLSVTVRVSAQQTAVLARRLVDSVARTATGTISAA